MPLSSRVLSCCLASPGPDPKSHQSKTEPNKFAFVLEKAMAIRKGKWEGDKGKVRKIADA